MENPEHREKGGSISLCSELDCYIFFLLGFVAKKTASISISKVGDNSLLSATHAKSPASSSLQKVG